MSSGLQCIAANERQEDHRSHAAAFANEQVIRAGGDQGERISFRDFPAALWASSSMERMYFSVRERETLFGSRSPGPDIASYIPVEKSQLSIWMHTRS